MSRSQRDPVRISSVTRRVTPSGRVSGFQVEVWHDGLNEHRVLFDQDPGVLENKVEAHLARWDEKYGRQLEREGRAAAQEAGRSAAETETDEAQEALRECREVLRHTLIVDDRVDWESLKNHAPFSRKPRGTRGIVYDGQSGAPGSFTPADRPAGNRAPQFSPPHLGLFDRIFSKRGERKEDAARQDFERKRQARQEASDKADQVDAQRKQILESEQQDWKQAQSEHQGKQDAANAKVDALRHSYENWDWQDGSPIEAHTEIVLESSDYPDWMNIDFEVGFSSETKTLVVEYRLPLAEVLPTVKSVTYVQSRGELKRAEISARDKNALYEDLLHQIALRTIHEVYEADEIGAIEAVVFNGWIDSVDPRNRTTDDRLHHVRPSSPRRIPRHQPRTDRSAGLLPSLEGRLGGKACDADPCSADSQAGYRRSPICRFARCGTGLVGRIEPGDHGLGELRAPRTPDI